MIASLRGVVTEKLLGSVIVECAGVGYGVLLTHRDFEATMVGKEARYFIYENIREDAHDLFGFLSLDSKRLFEQLLSVKNVGPKVAMNVLDIGDNQTLRAAIASGGVKQLQAAKGVGKRAAEQIIVELRDKVGSVASSDAEDIVTRGSIDHNDEAAQALMSLGYSEFDAERALRGIDGTLSVEERIKLALRG